MSIFDWRPRRKPHVVEHDDFDQLIWREVEDLSVVRRAKDDLYQHGISKHSAPIMLNDTYNLLYKEDATLRSTNDLPAASIPMAKILAAVVEQPEYRELHAYTANDQWGSVMGLGAMLPSLEQYADDINQQTERGKEIDQREQELEKKIEDAQGEPEVLLELQEEAAAIESDREKLDEDTDALSIVVARKAKDGIREQTIKIVAESNLADTVGVDASQLSPEQREKLNKVLTQFDRNATVSLADMLGRMKLTMLGATRKKTMHGVDEIYSVELGDDLTRTLPDEMVLMSLPETEGLFWSRWAEKSLTQYALRGTEIEGKGPIVVAVDESGSMSAEPNRIIWAKAFAITLAQYAMSRKRRFFYIGFSGSEDLWDKELKPGDAVGLVEVITHNFRGNTAFSPPLTRALELATEHKADVVFITDGQAGVYSDILDQIKDAKKNLDINYHGIAIDTAADYLSRKFQGAIEFVSITQFTAAEAEATMAALH